MSKRTIVATSLCCYLLVWVFTGCRKESVPDPEATKIEVKLSTTIKDFDREYNIKQLTFTAKERNTGKTFEQNAGDKQNTVLLLPVGLYDFSTKGILEYRTAGKVCEIGFSGLSENQTLSAAGVKEFHFDSYLSGVPDPEHPAEGSYKDLVIAEIFPSGTLNAGGKSYIGDQYIRIYNNSDKVVYADSLLILESSFLTTMHQKTEPNIVEQGFAADAIYMIPGNGREVPIEPGKAVVICDQGINHREKNPNSIDLSHADFEWYDETPADSKIKDVDAPNVPNLDKIYCYTRTIWMLHNRGGKSYGIAKMKTSKADFLANYKKPYVWIYEMADGSGTKRIDKDTYVIPTEWVADAVNMTILNGKEWLVIPTALDRGFTYVSKIDSDPERFGKSVMRKEKVSAENGRVILQDTNNSSDDFTPVSPASLLK